ncbi:hypothetical protein MKY91_20325 [Alkalicoccobacillus gibsonii]|uniref:Uncharacterized protein n=1 Tax=Alkalicoccobacillus gibsonii TaxID=79881 RepID=A0ABU9VNN7_9BACI
MNNIKLMKKVKELDFQYLHTREQSQRVMVQIATIRGAYGVNNLESNVEALDYERERVWTDKKIEDEFNQYIRFWEWAKESNNEKEIEFENSIKFYIDAINFFDETMAKKLKAKYVELKLNENEVA